MPLAATDKLDELYAVQRLVQAEVDRLQHEHDSLLEPSGRLRRYMLNVQIEALQEESNRLSARISDVLEAADHVLGRGMLPADDAPFYRSADWQSSQR